MNNDTANSGAAESNRSVRNIFVLKTNVLNSGIGGLRMRTTSLAYQAAYVTGIYLTLAHSIWCVNAE
jgi:hypothetical protein